jgi:hypothetical protein
MSDWGFVLVCWGAVFGSISLYSVRLMMRGRQLMERVPEDRRRWMSSND